MQKGKLQLGILLFYAFIAIIHLIGEATNNVLLSDWTKPLLIPALLIYFVVSAIVDGKTVRISNYVVTALVFSFFGDVLLMFVNYKSYFFLMGLGAFLIAQLFYMMTFRMMRKGSDHSVTPSYLILALATLYYVSLIGLIYGNLESAFQLPVMLYGAVITAMLVYSFHVRDLVPAPFGNLLFLGASLFVISDSLIAVNKFYTALPAAGFLVMSTYISAQFLIVRALIVYLKRKDS
jgi:uncharacterized membrane protein YhhN